MLEGLDLTLDRGPLGVEDLDEAIGRQPHHIAFIQVDESIGHRQQRQRVRRQEGLADADADHQRTALARADHHIGLVHRHDPQGVGTVETTDDPLEGAEQIAVTAGLTLQQVGDHLGIGLGLEHVALIGELPTQLLVILDDAVMHHRQAVPRLVGMGIGLAGPTVGRPAGVGNTAEAQQCRVLQSLLERGHLANRALAHQGAPGAAYRHAGTVIAAVLEALEAFEQNILYVALGHRGDDATHRRHSLRGSLLATAERRSRDTAAIKPGPPAVGWLARGDGHVCAVSRP